ncbi:hypothetical protein [Planococcus lenghuensis]|uniref:Uncharacterized protein n=1 Tax=Planococcus lenghuensis TaxID=2213202 RepID=A0A1Q2KY85_9BACL|nr:hypothetical protein [Planococcus lenghuensis]AQQ53149.1 hypothetical protein B0X71_08625 [Planococcus lenghuensis]
MSKFLYIFGLLVFIASLIVFIVNFFGGFSGMIMVMALFFMLNASIAMGVSEILTDMKRD